MYHVIGDSWWTGIGTLTQSKVWLKLILIFRSLLWPQVFLTFSSVETTLYLFFKYYTVENRLEQTDFKNELCMSYKLFLYKSSPIENP